MAPKGKWYCPECIEKRNNSSTRAAAVAVVVADTSHADELTASQSQGSAVSSQSLLTLTPNGDAANKRQATMRTRKQSALASPTPAPATITTAIVSSEHMSSFQLPLSPQKANGIDSNAPYQALTIEV